MESKFNPFQNAAEAAIADFQKQMQGIMAAGNSRTRTSAQVSLACMPPFIREVARLKDEKAKGDACVDALVNLLGGQMGSFIGSFGMDAAHVETLLKATFTHLMNCAAGAMTGNGVDGAVATVKIRKSAEVGHA